MNESFQQILKRFSNARVLVVGDVMLDRYWWGSATRISPEAPVPVVGLERVSCVPGGAANVAANVASFGAQAILAGVVGDDESGRLLRNELAKFGIEHSAVIADRARPTTTKTRVLAQNHQLARIDEESRRTLDTATEQALLKGVRPLIAESDVVILSDYAKGCLTSNLIESIVGAAQKAGRPVLADPKSRDFGKYNGVTVLTPNLMEALQAAEIEPCFGNEKTANILSIKATDFNSPLSSDRHSIPAKDLGAVALAAAAADRILSQTTIANLLVTLGEHGMVLFGRKAKSVHYPSHARQVFDVTGAGDTVIATLATALAVQSEIPHAAALANIAAGISVEKLGTSCVTSQEVTMYGSTSK